MTIQKAIKETNIMLEGYQNLRRKIEVLRYEMRHPNRVTPDEIISQMALPGRMYEHGHSAGHISDKTMYIALNYEGRTKELNTGETARIAKSLVPLEREAERLEFYVGLLPPRLEEILKLHYFDGLPWKKVAEKEFVTIQAVAKRRTTAISMLATLLFPSEESGCGDDVVDKK